MSENVSDADGAIFSLPSTPDSSNSTPVALSDVSPKDKPWDKHRSNADKVAALYASGGDEFRNYADRVTFCSELLGFGLALGEADTLQLKLRSARFCRVRHCPVCQWRRSLMWKARAYKVLPKIVEAYPTHRWLFLTLTQKNVPITELRQTLVAMNRAFQRLSQLKIFPAVGWLRSTEVTKGKNGTAHPHFHCLLMVPASYFGRGYIKQSEWVGMWRKSLRVDYNPVIDVQSVKTEVSSSLKRRVKFATIAKVPRRDRAGGY